MVGAHLVQKDHSKLYKKKSCENLAEKKGFMRVLWVDKADFFFDFEGVGVVVCFFFQI